MEPDCGLALSLRPDDHGGGFRQRHFCAVVDFTAGLTVVQQLRIHQGPGIDHHIRFRKEPGPPDGDQVHRAAAGAYKMYHI